MTETLNEEPRQLKVGDLLKLRRRFKGVQKHKIERGQKKAERNPARNIAARSERIARRHARAAAAERLSGGKKKAEQSLADRVRVGNRINKSKAIQRRIDREARRNKRFVRKDLLQKRGQKQKVNEALENKAEKWNIPLDILEQVFQRGLDEHNKLNIDHLTPEQHAFARVNSFATGGAALYEDIDLLENHKIVKDGQGGAGEWGTRKLRDKYLKDVPNAKIEPMYTDGTPIDRSKDMKLEGADLIKMVSNIKKKSLNRKNFRKGLEAFKEIRRKSKRKTVGAQAAMAANSVNLDPKDFLNWLEAQNKKGNLPKGLLE